MSVGTILIIMIILILVGALPTWPYSSGLELLPQWRVGSCTPHRDYSPPDGPVVTAA